MTATISQYKTTDIILAASLRFHGYKISHIDIANGRGTFNFVNVSNEFLVQYDLGKCLVEPVSFNNNIKQLTTSVRRMSSQQNNMEVYYK